VVDRDQTRFGAIRGPLDCCACLPRPPMVIDVTIWLPWRVNGLIAPFELTQKGFLRNRTFGWTQLL
jgi:hypothetical protein